MKHLKILGLAVFAAMAFAAFAGTTAASATVLCETNVTSNCGSAWSWNLGAELDLSLTAGSTTRFRDPVFGTTIDTCTESTLKVKIERGTPASTPGGIAHTTLSNCTSPWTEATAGEVEFHSIAGSDRATVTAAGFAMTIHHDPFGNMCAYGFPTAEDIGEFVPSANGLDGTISINKRIRLIAAHSDSGCISEAIMTANYTQTGTTPIYLSAS